MKLKKSALAVAMAMATGSAVAAPYTNFDTRAAGMGGLSIVTAGIDAAPFSNPAMLAAGRKDEGFGILATFGVGAGDPDNLTQDIDDFQNDFTTYVNSSGTDTAAHDAAVADYNNGLGKSYFAAVGGGAAMGFTLGQWAAAISYQQSVDAELGLAILPGTGGSFYVDYTKTPYTNAALFTAGVQTTDLGLSLARNFDMFGMNLAFGVTPKMTTTAGGSSITPLDISNPNNSATDLTFSNPSSGMNLDAGAVLSVTDNLKAGVVLKNAMAKSITIGTTTVNMAPQMRAGVAFSSRLFTVGADLDLTDNKPLISGSNTRYMIIGSEFNLFDWMQFRAGYRSNLDNTDDKKISAGFGVSPFGLHLDFSGLYNPSAPAAGVSVNVAFGLKF